jgi:hypothetical protein
MAKRWSEIIQSSEYQALTPAQRREAQEEYALNVLAPQVPKEDRWKVINEFYSVYPTFHDPTEGMSGGEKFAAGMGKAVYDLGRGVGQATGFIDRSEIDKAKRLDASLMDTGAGAAGNIAGNVLAAIPASFVPGANTLAGSAALGAGLGMLQPVGTEDSRLKNTALGAGFGLGGNLAARSIAAGAKGTKALTEPFYKSGQEQIAGRTLRAFAGNADEATRNLTNASEIIPGSAPTSAEVAKDAGIAQLQRGLQTQSPQFADELAKRALDQNSARLSALRELTKYGNNLDDALTRRAEAGAKLYEKAFSQQIRVDDKIKALTSRPSFQSALERAQRIAAEEGAPINNLFDQQGRFASIKALHYVKMGFDDLINDSAQSGIGKAELNAVKSTRGQLLDWMSENNPAYKTARIRFEKMSRPINREQVAREIISRSTRSQLPNMRGENTLYPDSFAKTLKEEGSAVAESVTGRMGKDLSDVMTPTQMKVLGNIRSDMSRYVTARDFGRSVGSNTAQNLASQNLLRQILGPIGLPQSWSESAILQTIASPINLASKYGGLEGRIQDVLGTAMLDPKYAGLLMRNVKPQNTRIMGLLARTPPVAGLLGSAIYAGQE